MINTLDTIHPNPLLLDKIQHQRWPVCPVVWRLPFPSLSIKKIAQSIKQFSSWPMFIPFLFLNVAPSFKHNSIIGGCTINIFRQLAPFTEYARYLSVYSDQIRGLNPSLCGHEKASQSWSRSAWSLARLSMKTAVRQWFSKGFGRDLEDLLAGAKKRACRSDADLDIVSWR